MEKSKRGGKREGQGRKRLPIGEKKVKISIGHYVTGAELAKLKGSGEKYNQLKESINQDFKAGIENILKIV